MSDSQSGLHDALQSPPATPNISGGTLNSGTFTSSSNSNGSSYGNSFANHLSAKKETVKAEEHDNDIPSTSENSSGYHSDSEIEPSLDSEPSATGKSTTTTVATQTTSSDVDPPSSQSDRFSSEATHPAPAIAEISGESHSKVTVCAESSSTLDKNSQTGVDDNTVDTDTATTTEMIIPRSTSSSDSQPPYRLHDGLILGESDAPVPPDDHIWESESVCESTADTIVCPLDSDFEATIDDITQNHDKNDSNENSIVDGNETVEILTQANVIQLVECFLKLHSEIPQAGFVHYRDSIRDRSMIDRQTRVLRGEDTLAVIRRGNPRVAIYDNVYSGNYWIKSIDSWRKPSTKIPKELEVLAAITFKTAKGPKSGSICYISGSYEHQKELRQLIRHHLRDSFNFDEMQNALENESS
jgi:hypothetical protein